MHVLLTRTDTFKEPERESSTPEETRLATNFKELRCSDYRIPRSETTDWVSIKPVCVEHRIGQGAPPTLLIGPELVRRNIVIQLCRRGARLCGRLHRGIATFMRTTFQFASGVRRGLGSWHLHTTTGRRPGTGGRRAAIAWDARFIAENPN